MRKCAEMLQKVLQTGRGEIALHLVGGVCVF